MTSNPGWRDLRGGVRARGRGRKRWFLTVLLVALVGGFVLTLMSPLRHPNGHLIYAVAGGDPRQSVVAPPFALEQYAHLTLLKSALHRQRGSEGGVPFLTPTRLGPEGLSAGLDLGRIGESDAVIVYLSAHQASGGDGPEIRPAGTDGRRDQLPVSQVLDRVRGLPGQTKLLLLDLATPLLQEDGLLLPESYVQQLADLVARTEDPTLWVLVSHSSLEQAHQSLALRRTVFGYFVARALQGDADLDGDRVITIAELWIYVRAAVSDWADRLTDGHGNQSPQLLWGGGRPTRSDGAIPLLPVVGPAIGPDGSPFDLEASIAEAQLPDRAARWQEAFAGGELDRLVPVSDRLREQLGRARLPRGGTPAAPPGAGGLSGARSTPATPGADALIRDGSEGADAENGAGEESLETARSDSEAEPSGSLGNGAAPAAATLQQGDPTSPAGGMAAAIPIDPAGRSELLDRLAQAWLIHDRLLEPRPLGLRPLDYAPDLWWTYQTRLLAVDQAIRAGWTFDTRPLVRVLEEDLLPMAQLVPSPQMGGVSLENVGPAESSGGRSGASLLNAFMARRPGFPSAEGIQSLALLSLVDSVPRRFDEPARRLIRQYQELIRTGAHEEFERWYQDARPFAFESLLEFRPLVHFSRVTGDDWPLFRRWLNVTWLGERAAIAVAMKRSWHNDLLDADRVRREGEREFIDRLRTDWRSRVQDRLADAERRYQGVLAVAEQASRIDRLTHDLMAWLPHYLALHVQGREHPEQPFPTAQDVGELFNLLAESSRIRRGPRPAFGEVRGMADSLASMRQRFIHFADLTEVERLIAGPVRLSDAWYLRGLLDTPLVPAAARMRLISLAAEIEIAGLREQPKVDIGEAAAQTLRALRPGDPLADPAELSRAAGLAERSRDWVRWQLAAFALADFGVPPGQALIPAEVTASWAGWLEANQSVDRFYSEYDALRRSVGEERRRLPLRLESLLDQSFDLADLEQRERRLMNIRRITDWARLSGAALGPPFDVAKVGDRYISSQRFVHLAWLAARDRLALAEAAPAEIPNLLATIRAHQEIAGEEAFEPALSPVAGPLFEVVGPDELSLAPDQVDSEVGFSIINRGPTELDVWLVADANPELLEFELEGVEHAYLDQVLREQLERMATEANDQQLAMISGASDGDEEALPEGDPYTRSLGPEVSEAARVLGFDRMRTELSPGDRFRSAALYPYRPDEAGLPASLRLKAGESKALVGHLRRTDGFARQTKLVLRAIAGGEQARHDTRVLLSNSGMFEVVISGTAGSRVIEPDDGERLLPYPNRPTAYQVGIRNPNATDLEAIVGVFTPRRPLSLTPPETAVPNAIAQAWLERLGGVVEVIPPRRLTLAANGSAVTILPPPKLPAQAGADAANGGDTEGLPTTTSTATEPGADGPDGISVTHGLLLVVHDPGADATAIRLVRIAPQRPRRYVLASASYDSLMGQFELQVSAVDPGEVPDGGIPIVARFGDNTPKPIETTLAGSLSPDRPRLSLTADIVPEDGRFITVEVDVDGFPRAFLFRFYPNRSQPNVPEWVDRNRLKIHSPVPGTAFLSPRETIPVSARVDAPVGAFSDLRDELWIGVDANRDRVFRNEDPVRLASDRQVDVRWVPDPDSETFDLLATLSDFTLEVPAGQLRDARVNLLSHLRVGGRDTWSDPVEVILDGQPPRVGGVRVMPGRVAVIGEPLELSFSAVDEMSGVLSVRCGFARPGTDQFAEQPAAVDAVLTSGGTWAATVPTEGLTKGGYRLLLQATDRVGNVSRPESVAIELRTEAEMEAEINQPKELSGVVSHGQTQVAGAVVELFPIVDDTSPDSPPPAALASRITDRLGRFRFERVAPGNYRLAVRGLVRNVRRRGEQTVTIPEGARSVPPVSLVLQ